MKQTNRERLRNQNLVYTYTMHRPPAATRLMQRITTWAALESSPEVCMHTSDMPNNQYNVMSCKNHYWNNIQ
jgi:hypothetical protein